MDYSNQKDKTIILKEKGKAHQLFIESIVYVESEGYVSMVHTNDDTPPVSCSKLLKEIEEEVVGYGFYRINRNIIVNLKYFKSYVKDKKRCFETTTEVKMKVSRRKWCVFRKNLDK
ncbi:MAG: LytTR family transcriptional regulator [Lentimicrobium sp.]|nr:LytTR family transcriptional regulator [Lentimicrobium sp.]